MDKRIATRLRKARQAVRKCQADALLVTNETNVTYLSGFTGDDSYLLLTPKHQIILSDSRYTTQLEEECPGFDLEIRDSGMSMVQLVERTCHRTEAAHIAIESESISLAAFERLRSGVMRADWLVTHGLVEQLREIKDKGEINEIRRSVDMAQRVYQIIRAGLTGEQSEKQIAADLEYQIRRMGGRGCSFPPIVAVGPRAALPHAVPTDRRVESADFLLLDWGATAGQYASDLTRILVTGRISPKLQRIYAVVLTAQQQAIAAIRPGVPMSEVDLAARQVIADAGFAKRFGHGLGHGIGLEIHEAPRLGREQEDPLQPGMVITVEPGIYLPGWGGVRIEDDVLVTRDGHEVLTSVPNALEASVV